MHLLRLHFRQSRLYKLFKHDRRVLSYYSRVQIVCRFHPSACALSISIIIVYRNDIYSYTFWVHIIIMQIAATTTTSIAVLSDENFRLEYYIILLLFGRRILRSGPAANTHRVHCRLPISPAPDSSRVAREDCGNGTPRGCG